MISLLTDELLEENCHAVLYALKARALNVIGDSKACLRYACRAIDIDPSISMGYLAKGNAHYSQKEYEEALENYNKAIQLDEKLVVAYLNRGSIYFNRKEYEKAVEEFTHVIKLNNRY